MTRKSKRTTKGDMRDSVKATASDEEIWMTAGDGRYMKKDRWGKQGVNLVRIHSKARRALFTPIDVKTPGGDDGDKPMGRVRITQGEFENGQAFEICDDWTIRTVAHQVLEMPWTGTTTFVE